MDIDPDRSRTGGTLTLAIDVGGSRLKVGVLDENGAMVAGPNRMDTPSHPVPQVVVYALVGLAGLPPGVFGLVAKVVALRPVVADQVWVVAAFALVHLRWHRVTTNAAPEDSVSSIGQRDPGGPV